MTKIYVLNYSESMYKKERVREVVEGLGGEIVNDFSYRKPCDLNPRCPETWLTIPKGDFELMTSAEEIWVVVGNKNLFDMYEEGEKLARKSKTKLRYFSLSHFGNSQGQFKEVDRNYWLKKK